MYPFLFFIGSVFSNYLILVINKLYTFCPLFFFFNKFIYLFIFGCVGSSFLCKGFPLAAASRGHSSSWCVGLSLSWPLLLQSTSSRRTGSVVVAHGPSCSAARGIVPDQGSNLCPLHWQADSQPLHQQGSPAHCLFEIIWGFHLKNVLNIKPLLF